MSDQESLRSRLAHAGVRSAAAVVLVVAVVAARAGFVGDHESVLAGLTTTAAGVLLMAVAAAVAHAVLEMRRVLRHDSIRAEIAAAGGLAKRLMF